MKMTESVLRVFQTPDCFFIEFGAVLRLFSYLFVVLGSDDGRLGRKQRLDGDCFDSCQ